MESENGAKPEEKRKKATLEEGRLFFAFAQGMRGSVRPKKRRKEELARKAVNLRYRYQTTLGK